MKISIIIDFLTSDLFASLGGGFLIGSVLMMTGVIGGNEPQSTAAVAAIVSAAR